MWLQYRDSRENHFQPQRAFRGYDKAIIDESGIIESDDFESDYMQWFETLKKSKMLIPDYADYNGYEGNYWKLDDELYTNSWTKSTALRELEKLKNKENPFSLKISFARPYSPYDS